jgi:serine carboxypeptidase-like clade II
MDGDTDLVGIFDSAWHHAIISDELYGDVQKNCDFSLVELSPECSADVDQYTALYRVIDIYSLYTDRCELGYPDFNYSVSPKTARGASRRGRVSALKA